MQYGKETKDLVKFLFVEVLFEDSWIDKENNAKLFDFLMLWLLGRIPIKVPLGFSNYVIL